MRRGEISALPSPACELNANRGVERRGEVWDRLVMHSYARRDHPRGLGTIWGPHVASAAGQSTGERTSRYTRTTALSCKGAYSNVLGVKGSRVQIPPSRLVRGF
jgi:hypothetical protein